MKDANRVKLAEAGGDLAEERQGVRRLHASAAHRRRGEDLTAEGLHRDEGHHRGRVDGRRQDTRDDRTRSGTRRRGGSDEAVAEGLPGHDRREDELEDALLAAGRVNRPVQREVVRMREELENSVLASERGALG